MVSKIHKTCTYTLSKRGRDPQYELFPLTFFFKKIKGSFGFNMKQIKMKSYQVQQLRYNHQIQLPQSDLPTQLYLHTRSNFVYYVKQSTNQKNCQPSFVVCVLKTQLKAMVVKTVQLLSSIKQNMHFICLCHIVLNYLLS